MFKKCFLPFKQLKIVCWSDRCLILNYNSAEVQQNVTQRLSKVYAEFLFNVSIGKFRILNIIKVLWDLKKPDLDTTIAIFPECLEFDLNNQADNYIKIFKLSHRTLSGTVNAQMCLDLCLKHFVLIFWLGQYHLRVYLRRERNPSTV
jgi:hypothetical protein